MTKAKKVSASPFNAEVLTELANEVLTKAKQAGASSAVVDIGVSTGLEVVVRKGTTESIQHTCSNILGVSLYFGDRVGHVFTEDLSPAAIDLIVSQATYIAKYIGADPCVGLPAADTLAYEYPDLDLYHPWDLEVDKAIAIAQECEAIGFAADKRIDNSDGAAVSTSKGMQIFANTHGFIGTKMGTRHSVSLALIAQAGADMQCDGYMSIDRDASMLESLQFIAKNAAERAVNRLNPRSIPTVECPVIFHVDVAGSLISDFIGAISGSALYRKASFLLDHLGKPVFAKHITIDERPHIKKAIGSAAFDAEGVKTQPSNIVIDGILSRYVLDTYAARRLQMRTTGNAGGVHNLFINTSEQNFAGLLKQMGTGLLVTDLMGDGVNLINGDYSRGVSGFWVEHGEIQYPVNKITIAGNLRDMLLNLVAVGNDVDKRGGIFTGSILLEQMMVAGQ